MYVCVCMHVYLLPLCLVICRLCPRTPASQLVCSPSSRERHSPSHTVTAPCIIYDITINICSTLVQKLEISYILVTKMKALYLSLSFSFCLSYSLQRNDSMMGKASSLLLVRDRRTHMSLLAVVVLVVAALSVFLGAVFGLVTNPFLVASLRAADTPDATRGSAS